MKVLNKTKITSILASVSTAGYLMLTNAQIVLAADGGEVQSKITNAANTIKGILTGIVVLVG
ncbi:CagC family type IV secretion system protein, partial [Lactiplantibacillus plantarum]